MLPVEFAIADEDEEVVFEPDVSLLSCDYNLVAPNKVELRFEINISGAVISNQIDRCIGEINLDYSAPKKVEDVLCALEERSPILSFPPHITKNLSSLSIRQALFSPWEEVSTADAFGRILSQPCVNCPPAVPIAICGERLNEEHITAFRYYGISSVRVVIEK